MSKRSLVLSSMLLTAVLATACGAPATGAVLLPSDTPAPVSIPTSPSVTSPAPAPTQGMIQLTGAGATFPYPLYSRWFYDYAFVDNTVQFNYQAIGSGGGIQQITAKTVDFGASDAILSSTQLNAAPSLHMFPTVAGAVVPAYNVKELNGKQPLVLDGATLSAIYLGTISKWNDPAIAALNPGLALPNKDIIVAHRSDGSGTTFIFTSYLSAVSPDWKSKVGASTSVQWPVGLGGKGNDGVSGIISQNDGSLGYIEYAYAVQNKLGFANMVNAAGSTETASVQTTQNAMNDFGTQMPDTLARLIVNAPGKDSWPIAGYTYFLVYLNQTDCAKATKQVQFLHWALTDGTKDVQSLDYVPLPDAIRSQDFATLGTMTCNGAPVTP